MMTKQIRSVALVACVVAAFSPVAVPYAQAKQQCNLAMPSNLHSGWWSYRIIDGRKCWYEGKPGLSKSLLEWPNKVSTQPASGEEVASTVPEKFRNPRDSQAWAPNSQARAPTDPDTFETRWRARAAIATRAPPEEGASVTDASPSTPEVDDVPPLRKADRLQSPYFDSRDAKSIRTLVIIPDPPHPGGRLK